MILPLWDETLKFARADIFDEPTCSPSDHWHAGVRDRSVSDQPDLSTNAFASAHSDEDLGSNPLGT